MDKTRINPIMGDVEGSMREIKFRAYDNHNKEWVYSNLMPDIGFWKWVAYDSTTVFNEWTGLKDKNGMEIYEGDIVRWFDDRTIAKTHLYKVMFGEYEINSDAYKSHNVGFYADNIDEEYNSFVTIGSVFTSGKYAEVIGNIHENPELLEG